MCVYCIFFIYWRHKTIGELGQIYIFSQFCLTVAVWSVPISDK